MGRRYCFDSHLSVTDSSPKVSQELSPPQGLQQHDKKAKKKKRKQEEGSAVGSDSGERSSKGDKQRKKVKREKHPDKNVSST